MDCQRCGTTNPDGASFCNSCGATLDATDMGASEDGRVVEDFARLAGRAGKMDIAGSARRLVAGGVVFILMFVAAFILSFVNSAIGTAMWVALMVALLLLALMTARSMKALMIIAPLMIFLAIIAAATDMGGNSVFNRLSTPILCRDKGELRVEERVQHPYAGKVVTEYVFFCQQEGAEWRVSSAGVIGVHALIYGGIALVLLGVYCVVALVRRSPLNGSGPP